MLPTEQFDLYGKYLDGTESELDLAKLARIRFLKLKMRDALAADIGDAPDNITDVLRAVIMAYGVQAGIITDAVIISRMNNYITQLLAGYGGAGAIMDVLEFDLGSIGTHVMQRYFVAKGAIEAAVDEESVMKVDIDGAE